MTGPRRGQDALHLTHIRLHPPGHIFQMSQTVLMLVQDPHQLCRLRIPQGPFFRLFHLRQRRLQGLLQSEQAGVHVVGHLVGAFALPIGVGGLEVRLLRQQFFHLVFDGFQCALEGQLQVAHAREGLFDLALFVERAVDLVGELLYVVLRVAENGVVLGHAAGFF